MTMSLKHVVSFAVVVALFTVILGIEAAVVAAPSSSSPSTTTTTTAVPTVAFLCADSGDYSGAHELGFLQNAIESRETLALSPCQSAYRGTIRHADGTSQTPVLVVTTGIGYVSAALCTRRVLNWEKATPDVALTKLVWIGTSGFSPMLGGWDPTNTSVFHHEAAAIKALQAAQEVDSGRAEDPSITSAATAGATATTMRAPASSLTSAEYAAHIAATASSLPVAPLLLRRVNFELFDSETQLDADGCSPRLIATPPPTTTATTTTDNAKKAKMAKKPKKPKKPKKSKKSKQSEDASPSDHAQPLSIGSICVTAGAFLQESAFCTETVEENQCSRPHCFGFARQTINRYVMDDSLARDIVAASEGKSFPAVPPTVREGMRQFWYGNDAVVLDTVPAETDNDDEDDDEDEAMRAAVGDVAAALTPSFVACAESTMNAIFVGAERDYLCREHTATVLNEHEVQFAVRQGRSPRVYTASDVVCVQAMEAFGFLQSMSTHAPARPIAIIRTASNYDMYPQQKLYLSEAHVARLRKTDAAHMENAESSSSTSSFSRTPWVPLGAETRQALAARHQYMSAAATNSTNSTNATEVVGAYVWSQNLGYVSAADYDAFVMASFHYSVKTAAFVLSNYFFGGRDFTTEQK